MSRLDASLAAPRRHLYIPLRLVQLELAARRSARLSRELYERLNEDEEFWLELAAR